MPTKGKKGRGGVTAASLAGPPVVELPREARRPARAAVLAELPGQPIVEVPRPAGDAVIEIPGGQPVPRERLVLRFSLKGVTNAGSQSRPGDAIHTERFGLARRRIAVLRYKGSRYGEVPEHIRTYMQSRYREGMMFWGEVKEVKTAAGRTRVQVEMWER